MVDMETGKPVKGWNPEKLGLVVGTTTQYLKQMNNNMPLKVDYAEEHKAPATLRWRSLMSKDIGSAIRSKVPMLAPTYGELEEEHRDVLASYMEVINLFSINYIDINLD